ANCKFATQLLKISQRYVDTCFKCFFGLLLLPSDQIQYGFTERIEDAKFPPSLWAKEPTDESRTTNGAESFHKIQTETLLKINSINKQKINILWENIKEKQDYILKSREEYQTGKLTLINYIRQMDAERSDECIDFLMMSGFRCQKKLILPKEYDFAWREQLLPSDQIIQYGFTELMSICPTDITDFSDYVLNNYIIEDAKFPPSHWAKEPTDEPRTINGAESFHSHYNSQFYYSHPNIYQDEFEYSGRL
ncbi:MULE domain-containing protein, partial [Aphis craccivora]